LGGCAGRHTITLPDYELVEESVEAPETAVQLQIDDKRAQECGGKDGVALGRIPTDDLFVREYILRTADRGIVPYLVRAATKDALRLARVAVAGESPRTVVVTLRTFCTGGPSGEGPRIVADLGLRDQDGATVWGTTLRSAAGGGWIFSLDAHLGDSFRQALFRYVRQAQAAFTSAEFQRRIY